MCAVVVNSRYGHYSTKPIFGDYLILSAGVLLSAIGILMVYSTTVIAPDSPSSSMGLFLRHVVSIVLGMGVAFCAYHINPRSLQKWCIPILIVGVISLIAVLLLGKSAGGATRWLYFGPLRLQPGEFVKLAVVISLASYISHHREKMASFIHGILYPGLFLCFFAVLFLLQPDFGSTAVIFLVSGVQIFMYAGISHFFSIGLLAAGAASLLIATSPYRMRRFTAFLDPFQDPSSAGYQLIQSLIAVGSGGFIGEGLGVGKQKLFYLPAAHTDFIFAVIAEEFGMLGCLFVIGLFLLIGIKGISLAIELAEDTYMSSLAIGLTALIVLPAILNMGVVLGLLPTKGLVLPFISYGGTAMLSSWLALGLLLRVSREHHESNEI